MASSSSTFGSQWPRGNGNIATLVRRDGLRIPLHRELIPLVSMLMDLTEAMGYDLVPGWCWGYANRPISGTRTPSNHSRGCAIDNNAPMNPYASASWHRRNATAHPFGLPRRTNIPQAVFELWEAHGFALGVRYASKPDPMHFEFVRTLNECRTITARLKAYLKHPDSALPMPHPKPAPKPAPPKPVQQEDEDVRLIIMGNGDHKWWITDGITKRYVGTKEEAGILVYVGLAKWNNGGPFPWPQDKVDQLHTVPRG